MVGAGSEWVEGLDAIGRMLGNMQREAARAFIVRHGAGPGVDDPIPVQQFAGASGKPRYAAKRAELEAWIVRNCTVRRVLTDPGGRVRVID